MAKRSDFSYRNNGFQNKQGKKNRSHSAVPIFMLFSVLIILFILCLIWILSQDDKIESDIHSQENLIAQNNATILDMQAANMTGNIEQAPTNSASNIMNDTSRQIFQNPVLPDILSPGNLVCQVSPGEIFKENDIVYQNIYNGFKSMQSFDVEPKIRFGNPLNEQSIPGILAFRGSHFRNAPSWGFIQPQTETMVQVWDFAGIGKKRDAQDVFDWQGTGWTGQPLVVEWDQDIKNLMNIYPEKKAKNNLKEVIIGALDGKIYFLDYDDGQPTRDTIDVGATIKGTPALDPRGYPLLYIGQGDQNATTKAMGFWIYNLFDGSRLHFENCIDPQRAYRVTWGAADGSPVVSGQSDTLIYPSENGVVYIIKLNTYIDRNLGVLTINPETYAFSYYVEGLEAVQLGIESSVAVYNQFAYWTDNAGYLVCLDLSTLQIAWMRFLGDQTDVTPVLEEEGNEVFLYVGTKAETQRKDVQSYVGVAYTYKINALTGAVVWQTSVQVYTQGASAQGGMFATPIVGKWSMSNLVVFAYCRTMQEERGTSLVAFDKKTGELVWRNDNIEPISESSPVDCYSFENAYIIMCDRMGTIYLLSGLTGEEISRTSLIANAGTDWASSSGIVIESTPVMYNGRLIVGTRSEHVFAVDFK